jgi:hypothetical protein
MESLLWDHRWGVIRAIPRIMADQQEPLRGIINIHRSPVAPVIRAISIIIPHKFRPAILSRTDIHHRP